jgi:pimeloyl-ACP methyl ester carboxylesterase
MPFADHQGVRIYYEVEGEGAPIVLAHDLGGNTTFWRGYGYVEPPYGRIQGHPSRRLRPWKERQAT